MDLLDRLLGHNEWATARIRGLSRDLTDPQLDQPFDLGNGALGETLNHIVYIIHFWTERMRGRSVVEDPGDTRTVPELLEWHERFYPAYAAFAQQATDEQRLNETFLNQHNIRKVLSRTFSRSATTARSIAPRRLSMLKRLGAMLRAVVADLENVLLRTLRMLCWFRNVSLRRCSSVAC